MGLGREVHNRIGPELRKHALDRRTVTDVSLNEAVVLTTRHHPQRLQIPRIGQLIQIQNTETARLEQMPNHRRTDEPRTTCYDYTFHCTPLPIHHP